jgi:predicted metalloprotease with PDZ domain
MSRGPSACPVRKKLAQILAVSMIISSAHRLSGASMLEPISYTLRFPAPQTHTVEVEAIVPTAGLPEVSLMMAVWTPGSYMIREFARNLEEVTAATPGGEPLRVEKTSKNRWRVETAGLPRITVRYRLYARDLSVRTNFVDESFALLNGAATFLTIDGGERRPHEARLLLPPNWRVSASPLPSTEAHLYRAIDFDTLVDSPLYAGNAPIYGFEVGGKSHRLLNEGEGAIWDGPRSAADAERIVREQIAFWGAAPYDSYLFLNFITESSGGLEHKDSSVLMTSRWKSRTREGHQDWLGLVSHELFHAWNVKRLRPEELGPFDYESEVYTRSLWFAEGVTSYYDDLLVHRAGLSERKEYLKRLSKQIESLQTTPGRLVQPLESSSFDAWIKYYHRDENTINSDVSYYTKGAVVAFLLDAHIRRATGGLHSLDDVLRSAFRRWSGERGFRPEELNGLIAEVAGADPGPWLTRALRTTEELEYGEALEWYGLRFVESEEDNGDDEKKAAAGEKKEPAGWLGVETELRAGRVIVTEVKRGTPGFDAGINVDDELIALGDYRVPPEGWKERLKAYRPGQKESLLVARRELLLRLPVVFGPKPRLQWKLEADPAASPEARAHLDAWLRSSAPGMEALLLNEAALEESRW